MRLEFFKQVISSDPVLHEGAELHHHAYEECYIANSVLTKVQVADAEPRT